MKGILSKFKSDTQSEEESRRNAEPNSAPPSYNEAVNQGATETKEQSKEKEYYQGTQANETSNYGPRFENGGQNTGYDVNKDPNVYVVPPQVVNISTANPQHLNPAYGEFKKAEEERWRRGDYPKPEGYYKHGAPLAPGKKNPNSKAGSFFPGRSGVSYNNSARGG